MIRTMMGSRQIGHFETLDDVIYRPLRRIDAICLPHGLWQWPVAPR